MTDTTQERPWVARVRNLVLVLGLLYAYGLVLMALHVGVGHFVANHSVTDTPGEFPWNSFLRLNLPFALATVVASAITGLLAAFCLRFAGRLVVVIALGAICAFAYYRGQVWHVTPSAWERWMQYGTSVAVGLVMPLVFLLAYRRGSVSTST